MIREKLYLPHDGVNYIGLLIGPKGMFQKKLEGESGCKILIRGKGSQKEGQPPQPDDDDEQHVLIMGDTQEAVDRAIQACNKIILADEDTRNMIRKEQLRVAAELNNNIYSTSTDNKDTVDESMLTPYGPASPYAYIVPVPNDCIGLIIGKKGETIKRLQMESGAKIQVAKGEVKETNQRYVFVEGSDDKYMHAKRLIEEIVDEWRRIHQKPDIPLESKPIGGQAQTVPIPNHLIGYLTGENVNRNDPKHVDIIPLIYDRYNVKVYIPDTADHSGNRGVEVSGDPDKVARAIEELFNYLREKSPGTNLMVNPLYYASATGLQQYSNFAYPGEVRNQHGYPPAGHGGYPPQHMPQYPPQYPPHGYPQYPGQQPDPHGYPGAHPGQERHQPHSQPQDNRAPHGQEHRESQPGEGPKEEQKHEESKQYVSDQRGENNSQSHPPAPKPDSSDKNPLAHQYAEHYSKSLGGDYQYYYDYYMKTYSGGAQPQQ